MIEDDPDDGMMANRCFEWMETCDLLFMEAGYTILGRGTPTHL